MVDTILLVDDDQILLRVMAKRLRGTYRVEVARSVAEAKVVLDSREVDAVVCDLHLGADTAASLRDYVITRNPPRRFVVLTGGAVTRTDSEFLATVVHVHKPCSIESLRVALESGSSAEERARRTIGPGTTAAE